jgi:hypothetical protein
LSDDKNRINKKSTNNLYNGIFPWSLVLKKKMTSVYLTLWIGILVTSSVLGFPQPQDDKETTVVAAYAANSTDTDIRMRFDGSQVWRVALDDQNKKNAIAELQMSAG